MLSLYNTLHKKKEIFDLPPNNTSVRMYTCGPTVYGMVHIGNIRAYLTADMVRRTLLHAGYSVRHIKNITDVGHLTADDIAQGDSGEDKVERKAKAEGKTPEEIARFYEEYFFSTERKMNILPAERFPRATEHVGEMIRMIELLISRGHAYEKNGNVFFDVTSSKHYGELSGNTLDTLKTGARLDLHPDKRNPWDFALWLRNPEGHMMHWPSPWGEGYPGWHIECSAMSAQYLGNTFDIHTGGEDNIFPHHEAEIAQSEGATGEIPFVRYWVHSRHLLINNEKMSKSKGNLYTIEDIEARGFSAMDLRLCLLSAHYRSPMNFTWKSIEQARKNRLALSNTLKRLQRLDNPDHENTSSQSAFTRDFFLEFTKALEDDINTPLALSIALEYAREINVALDTEQKTGGNSSLRDFEYMIVDFFGLSCESEGIVPDSVHLVAKTRQAARLKKDFSKADQLRKEIEEAGYLVEDTPEGYFLKPL